MSEINPLDALLGAELNEEKQVYIQRLNTYFTIKGIDGETFSEIQEEASYYTGDGANRKKEIDGDKMNWATIAKGCVNPDFKDKRVLEKYGAKTGAEAAKKALYAGEMLLLTQEIMKASGFQTDVNQVKN